MSKPLFPYWKFDEFNLQNWEDAECHTDLRFAKHDLDALLNSLTNSGSNHLPAMNDLQWNVPREFRIHRTTISEIVLEVCDNIFGVLAPEYLKVLSTTSEWLPISEKFHSRSNFPNGLLAVDGK